MGFSSPYGLAALGFVALLVLLHLRRRRQHEVEVSSLLLWSVVGDDPPRGRFRPSLLFALQVGLLGALALAVARPYWEERTTTIHSGRAVLVFDTSASMQTLETGTRRFDQARRKAAEVLAAMDADVEVMMISVAARPRIVAAFTHDRSALTRALEGLEPGDGPTRLSLGIELAHSTAGAGGGALEIDVFTDLPRDQLAFAPSLGERIRYFRFGRSDDNVALAALRVYQSPFQDAGEARGYVLVKNYAHQPKEIELHVSLDSKPLLDETLHLAPRESRVVSIDKLPAPGELEARLDVADALAVDNRAIAFVRPARKIRLLVVSADPRVVADLRAVARGVPALEIRELDPARFRLEDARQADVAVFHGFSPGAPPVTNSLYVYPPAEEPLFRSQRDVVSAQILDWSELDPMLQDLRYLEALALDRSRLLELPPWAHTLIASRADGQEFPLALAGELSGRRIVCFGFDLAGRPLVKSENLSLLLLMLNAIRWLTPADRASPFQMDVGETYREALPQALSVTFTSPDGKSDTLPASRQITLDVARTGEYRVRAGTEQRTIYANLFDGEESDVGRDAPIGEEIEGKGTASPAVSATALHELARALLWIGLLLAFGEWGWWTWDNWRARVPGDVV